MFADRIDAGRRLAGKLRLHPAVQPVDPADLLVLSIPRGGVVIGDAVARALDCAHDVVIVKKIGFPGHEELAIGAMAEDGQVLLNREILVWYGLTTDEIKPVIASTRAKIQRYVGLFRQGEPLDLGGKSVIIVDDGIATGETVKAAIRWIRSKPGEKAALSVIVAAPVCSQRTAADLEVLADEFICLYIPELFMAVGQFYQWFEQVSDSDALNILQQRRKSPIDDVA